MTKTVTSKTKTTASKKQLLPKGLYETLRWAVWIVLPAVSTLISILNGAWNWGLPIDAILTTFGAVETFLGTILGIAKVSSN